MKNKLEKEGSSGCEGQQGSRKEMQGDSHMCDTALLQVQSFAVVWGTKVLGWL